MAGWLPQAKRQLEELARLAANWDGGGPLEPTEASIRVVEALLCLIAAGGIALRPCLYPAPDGAVRLEWETGHRYVHIEVRSATDINVAWQMEAAEEPRELSCLGEAAIYIVLGMVREILRTHKEPKKG